MRSETPIEIAISFFFPVDQGIDLEYERAAKFYDNMMNNGWWMRLILGLSSTDHRTEISSLFISRQTGDGLVCMVVCD